MWLRAWLLIGLLIGPLAGGCSVSQSAPPPDGPVRYVALGDSYTIGTAVPTAESWPSQLVARLPADLRLAANLGVNGYTSADVIALELPQLAPLNPEFVTLLIGVNDVVQGVGEAEYAGNVEAILLALLDLVPAERIVTVATPDYTRTPAGSGYGSPTLARARIVRFNLILAEAATRHEIAFVAEPFAISQGVVADSSLMAPDGLHPSGAQYSLWVDAIAPVVEGLLAD